MKGHPGVGRGRQLALEWGGGEAWCWFVFAACLICLLMCLQFWIAVVHLCKFVFIQTYLGNKDPRRLLGMAGWPFKGMWPLALD